MVSLRQHLKKAAKARWTGKTEEQRKEHSAMMSAKRWPKKKPQNSTQIADAQGAQRS